MRDPRTPADSFRLDSWLVEPSLNTLTQGAQVVRIEPRTMNVLAYLAARAGKVVSQGELEEEVWKDVVVTPQSVYQSIAQLRRVLGDDARDPKYIATVSRRGYRLIAAVTPAETAPSATGTSVVPADGTPRAASAARTSVVPSDGVLTAPEPPAPRKASWHRRPALIAIAAVIALAATAAAFLLHRNWGEPSAVSIAVLPFHDLSNARNNAPFCDGLTDELSSALAQLSEVRVIARDSTYLFRNSKHDAREIGSRLGVTHLLEGSVRRDANHLRVTAALIDASNGVQVWSRSIDKGSGELLRVQQEIANDVVAALKLELSPQSAQRLREQRAVDPNAYELYLLGRYQQLQREPAALERAIGYHKESLARDPSFALAYAGLADAQMALYYYRSLPLDETAPEVEANVQHALDLDSGLAEAYAARAVLRTEQWRLQEAIADLEKAIVLKPNNSEALIRLGAAYEYLGQPRDALKQYDQAVTLDPLHFILHVRRCLTLQNMGRFGDATQSCARARELQPENPNGYWTTGLIALARGDLAGATDGYERALAKAPWRVDLLLQLAWISLDAGTPDVARRYFDAAESHQNGNEATQVALERARFFVATGAPADLAQYLDRVDLSTLNDASMLLDAALLEMVANRTQRAHDFAQRARAMLASSQSGVFENVWDARWGRNPRLTLALDALANGDKAEAERQLTALEHWLDTLEAHGQVWHGVKYLRACVQSLRGRKADALASLDDAVEIGWRRAWWTEADPALESIRQEKAFPVALDHMRTGARPLHAAVSGQ
jgi:TolB-like protein/DNA-binding winged helix-turn-helix (wHTH) protein/Tfp pilus assembly protein PilF